MYDLFKAIFEYSFLISISLVGIIKISRKRQVSSSFLSCKVCVMIQWLPWVSKGKLFWAKKKGRSHTFVIHTPYLHIHTCYLPTFLPPHHHTIHITKLWIKHEKKSRSTRVVNGFPDSDNAICQQAFTTDFMHTGHPPHFYMYVL